MTKREQCVYIAYTLLSNKEKFPAGVCDMTKEDFANATHAAMAAVSPVGMVGHGYILSELVGKVKEIYWLAAEF